MKFSIMKKISVVIVVFLTLVMTGGAQAACGKVTIADMNWPSATLMAHVDAMILKYGYGCDAELITGDTMPTGTSMIEKGEPDIAPELWTNSFAEALQKGIDEKRLRIAGKSLSDGGEEGFWVPPDEERGGNLETQLTARQALDAWEATQLPPLCRWQVHLFAWE